MKKISHKVLSFLMAIVVLFSTMSFTIDMHYCGDILVDTALFSKVKTCGMESETSSNNNLPSSDCSITKKDCCSNKHQAVTGQDELQLKIDKISFDNQIFAASFLQSHINLFESSEEVRPYLTDYPPPNIVRHIYKLDESYLI